MKRFGTSTSWEKWTKKVFTDPHAELYRGFTLTVDLLAENTLVLKHKIVHRLNVTRTLSDLDNDAVSHGDEIQSIYDHKNTYFFEKYQEVDIDTPMDASEPENTYRRHYIRKFQKKCEDSCLKKAMWEHCLKLMRVSPPRLTMIECVHEKDGKPCKLFKGLTTLVQIPAEIVKRIPQATRVKTSDKFDEVKSLNHTLSKKRPESELSPGQVLDAWGVVLGKVPLSATTMQTPAPTVKISGHKGIEHELRPQWMKDIKLDKPMNMASIGVYYEKSAFNVAKAYWPMIAGALQQKNALFAKTVGPKELKGVKTITDIFTQIREDAKDAPLSCYVFFLSGDKHYAALKTRLMGDRRIVVQVIQAQNQRQNIGKAPAVIITHNIALQIMAKLGACPWVVQIPPTCRALRPTGKPLSLLIIGIDVSHGQKRFDNTAKISRRMSYVGLSAYYMVGESTTFFGMPVQQTGGKEVLDAGSLKQFFEYIIVSAEHCPSAVVVFRDGVGKGQFEAAKEEGTEIRTTLLERAKTFNKPAPRLCYTVVTKRISEDFGVKDGRKAVEGGLAVIDPKICTPNDFYLVTDKRMGFVHYHMLPLADATAVESIPRDEIMLLAFNTAFQYFNWPGAVKIPAALQYAHTVSKMAGEYFDKDIKLEKKKFLPHRGLMYI